MEITCLKVGEMGTNCYLVLDEESQETLIIDPGDEGDFISTTLLEKKLIPKGIVLTHGHYDHCLGALELKLNFSLPIYLHQKDLFLYEKAHLSAKHFSGISIPKLPKVDNFLTDNQIISFGNSSLQVVHTPGHTPGSVCLVSPKVLFTGDTLFASGPGATDHPYSSSSDLQSSLSKLNSLFLTHNSSLLIYPGHEDYGFSQSQSNQAF